MDQRFYMVRRGEARRMHLLLQQFDEARKRMVAALDLVEGGLVPARLRAAIEQAMEGSKEGSTEAVMEAVHQVCTEYEARASLDGSNHGWSLRPVEGLIRIACVKYGLFLTGEPVSVTVDQLARTTLKLGWAEARVS